MQFATFENVTLGDGDKLQAQNICDTPLLVFPTEELTGLKTKYSDNGHGVKVDVLNLANGEVFINVLWMGGAVVDNLVRWIGQAVGIKLVKRAAKNPGGNEYIVPVPLEGEEAQAAYNWATKDPEVFVRTRTERGIEQAEVTLRARTGLSAASTPPAQQQPQTRTFAQPGGGTSPATRAQAPNPQANTAGDSEIPF